MILRPLACRVFTGGYFLGDSLTVFLILLGDGRPFEGRALAVMLGVSVLVDAGTEELNLLTLIGRRAAVLCIQGVQGDLLRALAGREESWEVVLVFQGRAAGGGVL